MVIKSRDSVSYKRSLLMGVLLGRAKSRKTILKNGALKATLSIDFPPKLADLAGWLAEEMNIAYKAQISPTNNGRSVRLSWSQGRRLRVIHDWFHQDDKKVISDKIRFMDHPIGLTMLLCDAGSVRKRKKKHRDGSSYYLPPSIELRTAGFAEADLERLQQHIVTMCGAQAKIQQKFTKRRAQKIPFLQLFFDHHNASLLWSYLIDWMPKVVSMNTKFSFAYQRFDVTGVA